jgi:hypothetical protein
VDPGLELKRIALTSMSELIVAPFDRALADSVAILKNGK